MAIDNNQKLNYIEVILQECVEGHPEPVLIDVAVQFLRELQESKDD